MNNNQISSNIKLEHGEYNFKVKHESYAGCLSDEGALNLSVIYRGSKNEKEPFDLYDGLFLYPSQRDLSISKLPGEYYYTLQVNDLMKLFELKFNYTQVISNTNKISVQFFNNEGLFSSFEGDNNFAS